jgi:hypothetical protein
VVPPDAANRPIRIVLRNNAVVFEVKVGSVEVSYGLERFQAGPGASVAVSRHECWISPIEIPQTGLIITTHIVGTLPLRTALTRNPAIAGILAQLRDKLPGIFFLGEQVPHVRGVSPDPGEQLVSTHIYHPGFLRFVASIPKALYRPEAKRPIQARVKSKQRQTGQQHETGGVTAADGTPSDSPPSSRSRNPKPDNQSASLVAERDRSIRTEKITP